MIKFSGCREIDIKTLQYDVEDFRTHKKDYPDDELFMTEDDKYIILCHTITEGSNGSYYTQIIIFNNNANQSIRVAMHKIWAAVWLQNFYYLRNSQELIFSITCYDAKFRDNPTPTLIIRLPENKLALLPMNIFYHTLDENKKDNLRWRNADGFLDLCK